VLGSKYESKRSGLFIRSFDLGGHTFKVRIPTVAESDEIYAKIAAPNEVEIEEAYQKIVGPLMQLKNQKDLDSEFEFTETDVLIDGRSLRETAKTKIQTQVRITEFIKLLVPENPEDSLADLTYAEVEFEFPMAVQMALIEKIAEAVSPTYKETRGN
jgi:hypothetical protein